MLRSTRNLKYSKLTPVERKQQLRKSLLHHLIAVNPSRLGIRDARNRPKGMGCLPVIAGILLLLFVGFIVLIGFVIAGTLSVYSALASSLPPADQLANIHVDQSTKIYDRNGDLLYEVVAPTSGRRTILQPEQIPEIIKQATIATEDPSFYTNSGIDPSALVRVLYYAQSKGTVIGGSTITQQLVKNTLLTPEATLERKIREAMLSIQITQKYPKEQILALYLNTNNYGNLAYGIQAASQSYFKKDVGELDLAEATLLAGLPQQPAIYDPCQNPEAALNRQKIVLGLMLKQGYVDAKQSDAASDEMKKRLLSKVFTTNCTAEVGTTSPHFVAYVRQVLEEKYGPEALYRGGLQVYTTIDPAMQRIAEDEARKQIDSLKGKHVSDAAVVAMNPRTGEIYAMLGSVDFFDKSIDGQVNVATRLRQPGSSIKPINYVTALKRGWTLATPILDAPAKFPNGNEPPYVPINYDKKFHGIVNVRTALANSLNIPAIKTLYFVGVPEMMDTAQSMGITTLRDPSRYGLSLTLGGGEVQLVELTGAYSVFANQGQRVPFTPFRKIIDGQGRTIFDVESNPTPPIKVLDPRYAYLMTSVLSDNNARAPEFGLDSPLKLSRPAAAKTGTTNDFRDNWTMGYTPELVVGVWVGNKDNSQMQDVSGISGAAPIWHNFMERVYKEVAPFKSVAPHAFPIPSGLVQGVVCNESGLLAGPGCPPKSRHTEIFLAEQAPKEYDKFWGGGWGNLCVPKFPDGELSDKAKAALQSYEEQVKWATAHNLPQSLAGVVFCSSQNQGPAPGSGTPSAFLGTNNFAGDQLANTNNQNNNQPAQPKPEQTKKRP